MNDFHKKLEREISRLKRYAHALLRKDAAGADDLLQDTLVRALAKQHLWTPETDLRAWLFTIMHNQYVNFVRKSVREGTAVSLENQAAQLAREGRQGESLKMRDLDTALAKLPEEQRIVVLLIGWEGLKYEPVAKLLGVPVGTVRSRLSRARTALRQHLDRDPPPPDGRRKSRIKPRVLLAVRT